jgi:hypothetical protein
VSVRLSPRVALLGEIRTAAGSSGTPWSAERWSQSNDERELLREGGGFLQAFDYAAAQSVDEAVSLLAQHGDQARVLAGGTDIIVQVREGRRQVAMLVDIKGIPEANQLSYDASQGLTIGAAAGVHIFGPQGAWLALAPILTVILLVRPQLVNNGIRSLARVLRRPEPKRPVSARGMRLAVAAQSLSWLVSGLHLWLLAILMGAPPVASLALCVGAYSLAVAVGMLAIVVPDGIGIREAILTGALAVLLPLPAAVAATLASRLITVLTDAIVGTIALTVTEIARRREPGHPDESRPAASHPDVQSAQPASQDEQATTR